MEGLFGILLALEAAKQNRARREVSFEDKVRSDFFKHLRTGNYVEIKRLIERGLIKDLNEPFSRAIAGEPLTPLQIASMFSFHEICVLLIRNGADVNYQSIQTKKLTALHFSVLNPEDDSEKMAETARILISNGANWKLVCILGNNFFDLLEREISPEGGFVGVLVALNKSLVLAQIKSKMQEFFREKGIGTIHYGVKCSFFDRCKVKPIIGTRYHLTDKNLNLCPNCFRSLSEEVKAKHRTVVYELPDKIDRVIRPRNIFSSSSSSSTSSSTRMRRKEEERVVRRPMRTKRPEITISIFECLDRKRFDYVEQLVSENSSIINSIDRSTGCRPIHYVSRINTLDSPHRSSQQLDQISRLVKLGCNINSKCASRKQFTALHYAVLNSNSPLVKHLLRLSADPNCVDANSWIPLYYAIQNESTECLDLLLPVSDLRYLMKQYQNSFTKFHEMYGDKNMEIRRRINREILKESRNLLDCVRYRRKKERRQSHIQKGGNIRFLFFHYIRNNNIEELKDLVRTMKNERGIFSQKRCYDYTNHYTTLVFCFEMGSLEIMQWLLQLDRKVFEKYEKQERNSNSVNLSVCMKLLFRHLKIYDFEDVEKFLRVVEIKKGRNWEQAFEPYVSPPSCPPKSIPSMPLPTRPPEADDDSLIGREAWSSYRSPSAPSNRVRGISDPNSSRRRLKVGEDIKSKETEEIKEKLDRLQELSEKEKLRDELRSRRRKYENESLTRKILSEGDFSEYADIFILNGIYARDFRFMNDDDLRKIMENPFHIRRFLTVFSQKRSVGCQTDRIRFYSRSSSGHSSGSIRSMEEEEEEIDEDDAPPTPIVVVEPIIGISEDNPLIRTVPSAGNRKNPIDINTL